MSDSFTTIFPDYMRKDRENKAVSVNMWGEGGLLRNFGLLKIAYNFFGGQVAEVQSRHQGDKHGVNTDLVVIPI
jgi:hypothetical protein